MQNIGNYFQILIKIEFSRQIFEKSPNKISWKIRPVEAGVFQADSQTDTHTDMTK
jgi:hypothetical protein